MSSRHCIVKAQDGGDGNDVENDDGVGVGGNTTDPDDVEGVGAGLDKAGIDAAGDAVGPDATGAGVGHVMRSHPDMSSVKQLLMARYSIGQCPHEDEHWRMTAHLMMAASSHEGSPWASRVAESKHWRQVPRVSLGTHAANASISSRHRNVPSGDGADDDDVGAVSEGRGWSGSRKRES